MADRRLDQNKYTTLGPDEIWRIYNTVAGIFRGGGSEKSPKLARADGPRRSDLLIVEDPDTGLETVQPCSTKGLSFADSIDVLSRKRIEGKVWLLPRGARLPDGLVFNVKDIDHPLLNVSKPMSVLDLMARLTQLAALMDPCFVKIDKLGRVIEEAPGALRRASQR